MQDLKKVINEDAYNNEFSHKLLLAEKHFKNIYKACNQSFMPRGGSYLFNGEKYEYFIGMYPKQKLLYDVAKDVTNVLEIGVYMGHSILLMLISNPKLNITCIDIDKKFSKPATDYLANEFPDATIQFIQGDSLKILQNLKKKYDLFHIDGDHKNHIITKELNFCLNLSGNKNFKVIFDDIDSCLPLRKNILSSFNIAKNIIPNCPWRNCYIEIKVEDQNLFEEQKKDFQKKSLFAYLKFIPIRIINFLLKTIFLVSYHFLSKKMILYIKSNFNKKLTNYIKSKLDE